MTSDVQIDLIKDLDEKTLDLIIAKSNDYAQEADVLSNFKIVSKVVELIKIDVKRPEGYAMLMVILKIVRIWNLKSEEKDVKNESVLDSYRDGINYFKLAYANEVENSNTKKS
jgi:hypothetical protein